MPFQRFDLIVAVFLLLLFAAPDVSGKALEDRKWIEVKTANFLVRSTLGEKKTVKLAYELEVFRAAVAILTNISSTDTTIPTEIFVFKKKKDFMRFGLDYSTAGVFLPELRNNTILIRNAAGIAETSIIMHEYVHFIMRNNTVLHYPKWYDEGFAEYLGASDVKGDFFELGIAPEYRISSLNYTRWIPIRKIVSAEGYDDWHTDDQAMFYAESWALVHYLINQDDPESSFTERIGRYIQLVESGENDVDAFETAFEIQTAAMNREVRRYLSGRLAGIRIRTAALLPDFSPSIRTPGREEISLGLAQLALRRQEPEMAATWFTIAKENAMARPRAIAGLGNVFKLLGDHDRAEALFDEALALAPDDVYVQLDVAEFWHDRSYHTSDASVANDYLRRARTHYVKAWKLDDAMPEIYARYGQTFLIQGEDNNKAIEMLESAHSLLPSNLDVRMMLAQAYASADRKQEAIDEARAVLAWSHSDSDAAKRAKEILDRMNFENSEKSEISSQ